MRAGTATAVVGSDGVSTSSVVVALAVALVARLAPEESVTSVLVWVLLRVHVIVPQASNNAAILTLSFATTTNLYQIPNELC